MQKRGLNDYAKDYKNSLNFLNQSIRECLAISVGVPRRLFFAAPQRIAITLSPKYYQKMQRSITRKNQEEHGPEVK